MCPKLCTICSLSVYVKVRDPNRVLRFQLGSQYHIVAYKTTCTVVCCMLLPVKFTCSCFAAYFLFCVCALDFFIYMSTWPLLNNINLSAFKFRVSEVLMKLSG